MKKERIAIKLVAIFAAEVERRGLTHLVNKPNPLIKKRVPTTTRAYEKRLAKEGEIAERKRKRDPRKYDRNGKRILTPGKESGYPSRT